MAVLKLTAVSVEPCPSTEDNATGVPGLRTWPRVYGFVAGCFLLWVGLLTALMKVFS